ncbi:MULTISPECIES: GNAT family N-acetyltransferase [unclassified Caulobacter]|jgi:ribosomal protein S18 acetylase RimI-like enzyme|uniref:GNAT family N-acetyltransferase n=1 Tax=unclassified Caulobacter TaxID=2648921 RepID=UPI0006FF9B60|nr:MULTISPECIES: GNAT family N-acetyltransferase [unclassified Caulobacter]KQV58854.1 acetyltransferase [Caulobacter sp. Root342]KQV68636.1 acetyltransferase [Caulobacter sp. Root343]
MPLLTLYKDHELADIAALVNSAYRGELAQQGWTSESYLLGGQRTDEATLRADLAAKPGSTLLTFRDEEWEKPYACAWLELAGDDAWYVGMVTVSPLRQDGGIGRAMLETCEAYAKARGGKTIRMTVISVRDTLIAWYERRGYRLTGETEPFPYGDERFGVPQRDDLCFVIMEKAL